jgi:NADH-quinone oxidoreductase subunit C
MISSLVKSLASTFKGVAVEASEDDRIFVLAPKDSILAVLSYLKENGLDHLALISCVDRQQRGRLELVYILSCYLRSNTEYGPEQKLHILLKTEISRDSPELQSAIGVFANAEPYEREIHELFGVHFAGHPRLIPLFLEREYEIPPFRKDFDTREYVAEIFDAIPPVDK